MRRRFTYANVAATMALVFSMSGGALAAKHYLISSTKQISPKVLKKLKGATGKAGAAGKEGAAGKNGSNGINGERGPSNGFSSGTGSTVEFPSTAKAPATAATLALPAGSFVLSAKVLINNNKGIDVATCKLLAGGTVVDSGGDVLTLSESAPGDRGFYVLGGNVTLASAGSAEVKCESSSTEGNYLDQVITAVQVASIA